MANYGQILSTFLHGKSCINKYTNIHHSLELNASNLQLPIYIDSHAHSHKSSIFEFFKHWALPYRRHMTYDYHKASPMPPQIWLG